MLGLVEEMPGERLNGLCSFGLLVQELVTFAAFAAKWAACFPLNVGNQPLLPLRHCGCGESLETEERANEKPRKATSVARAKIAMQDHTKHMKLHMKHMCDAIAPSETMIRHYTKSCMRSNRTQTNHDYRDNIAMIICYETLRMRVTASLL